jgi:hypothetical protein
MIKADMKGKASGLENLRPYHRMESMRKSNILSLVLFLLVSSSRIRTYSLLNWPKAYISHCGGPFFLMSLGIIPFSKIFFWHYYWIHKPILSHFYFLFLINHSFKCVSLLCGRCLKFSLKRDGKWEQGEPVCWSFFLCTPGGHFC